MDPFALPCHRERRIDPDDRDWREIGVKSADDVRRKQTRCPDCKTSYTAFLRTFGSGRTVEWVQHTPFRVTATPLDGGPVWQDAEHGPSAMAALPHGEARAEVLRSLQQQTAALGPAWERSAQLCTPSYVLTAAGDVIAEPGDLLLERREKWNAQDRRLALMWSPRLQQPAVVWHGFARILQE